MNKKVLVIIVVVLLLGAGGFIYALSSNKADGSNPNNRSSRPNDTHSKLNDGQAQNSTSGKYIDYTEDAIATNSGQKVLFFHAPWCPQCRSIESGILEGPIPANITIIKVDYDSRQDLRQRYGVTLQTSFVKVDDQGNLISKYVAYDEPTFDAVKRNFLQ